MQIGSSGNYQNSQLQSQFSGWKSDAINQALQKLGPTRSSKKIAITASQESNQVVSKYDVRQVRKQASVASLIAPPITMQPESSASNPHDILNLRRESFEREYKAGGTQAVVDHFGAPVTKNVAEWFARKNRIKTSFKPAISHPKHDDSAANTLRNRSGSFEREYKAGGTQAVVDHFGAPVTRDIAKAFASKQKIKRSS